METIAGFLAWDPDAYLVITPEGRLVWMVDGYTTSSSHPYSKLLETRSYGDINYIRNSVKATVDAYDGTVHLYAFDTTDPILKAYRTLFPHLFQDVSTMPPALRAHARYPEVLFQLQAEIYRTYHMTNVEAFFNKEDMWDLSRSIIGTTGKPETVSPTYLVASLPNSDEPEFLLMTTFTPRNKDNLIGLMLARCDGEKLGELHFLQLSKQQLVDVYKRQAENSVLYYLALRRAGVKAEMHIYQEGQHGVGLAPKDAVLGTWPARLKDWLAVNGFVPGNPR